jgi:hypothetical protein
LWRRGEERRKKAGGLVVLVATAVGMHVQSDRAAFGKRVVMFNMYVDRSRPSSRCERSETALYAVHSSVAQTEVVGAIEAYIGALPRVLLQGTVRSSIAIADRTPRAGQVPSAERRMDRGAEVVSRGRCVVNVREREREMPPTEQSSPLLPLDVERE